MRKLLQAIPILLMFVGASLLFEQRAYAYTDPGTGLLAIQAAGSALVATGWYLRRKIYGLVRILSSKKDQQETHLTDEEDEGSRVP